MAPTRLFTAARETVAVEVVVPGFVPAGTNRLTFGVSFTGADGAEVTCTRDLHVPLATLDVPISGGAALLRIQPNPARRELSAVLALPGARPVVLELFDMAGRRLSHQHLYLGEGSQVVRVAPHLRLAPGVYVVKATSGASAMRARAVVID